MPVLGITTPIEFATGEWDKLARAWRNLNPTQRDLELERHINELRDQGKIKLYPELPGWDDILRTGRVPAGATPEEIAARRKRVIARIRQSTTPREQQAVANVINAIDDVQDLASFAGLVARLVLRAAPRVAARFIPVLGWVATASDVLNLLSFLTLTGGVALGIRSEGVLGGAAAIAGPTFVKAALKREMWTMLRRSAFKGARPRALSQQLSTLFAAKTKLPTGYGTRYAAVIGKRVGFGEILEAGQAIETLTGYGLSLGAVMGYLSDAAWALYRDVAKVPHHLVGALKGEVQRAAPPEWFMVPEEDTAIAWDPVAANGPGPTHVAWSKRYADRTFPTGNTGNLAVDPKTKPRWCYFYTWVQHPRYPSQPDSVAWYLHTNFPPSDETMVAERRWASEVDLILTARPTVDGY